MTASIAFGVDIGGSGIKGAPVDLSTGELSAERVRIPTPKPSKPAAVAKVVAEVVDSFDLPKDVPVGITFPAIIVDGVARSAANVDDDWIGTDVEKLISKATGRQVFVCNDADAAGVAEAAFGAAKGVRGNVIVTTIGTGIGSAFINDGVLVPNTELGHLELDGHKAEHRIADSVREREDLSWERWAKRLSKYYQHVEFLFSPSLFVVGGGVSKKHAKWMPQVECETKMVPAALQNNAGIVGAAHLAAKHRS
ncbi:ROK family protein [Micrococcales bacterium 31B]|nr:ROK family protein [Micrococcales bacterium 31B]